MSVHGFGAYKCITAFPGKTLRHVAQTSAAYAHIHHIRTLETTFLTQVDTVYTRYLPKAVVQVKALLLPVLRLMSLLVGGDMSVSICCFGDACQARIPPASLTQDGSHAPCQSTRHSQTPLPLHVHKPYKRL